MTNNKRSVKNLSQHSKDIIKTSIERKIKKKLKNILTGDVIVPNLFDGTHDQLVKYNEILTEPELKEIIDFLDSDDYNLLEDRESFLANWLDTEDLKKRNES